MNRLIKKLVITQVFESDDFYEALKINILQPINDGEDFAYKFRSGNVFNSWGYETIDVVGRSFGDLCPNLKGFYFPIFERVYKTHEHEVITVIIYEEDKLISHISVDVVFKNGDICFLKTDNAAILSQKEELDKLLIAVQDVQEAKKTAIHYQDSKGNYYWNPVIYNIIEREPRDSDKNNHITCELLDENDRIKVKNEIEKLQHGEFLGDLDLKITLESGKIKYIKINSRKLFDEEGNFIQRTGYTQDITEEYLKNEELLSLNKVVLDVEDAASIAIYYMDKNAKWHYSDAFYKIIGRGPRKGDEDIHLLRSLMSEDILVKFDRLIASLKPNEKYEDNDYWPITTELGEIKYLRGFARNIHDGDGNFIRRSEFIQDVTEEYLKNRNEFISLNAVVGDVEEAASIAISYLDCEGRYRWSDEIYKIIDREPRESDEYTHVIRELMSKENTDEFDECISTLRYVEFYNDDKAWLITTESGKIKYLRWTARKIYDEYGNFIRRSEFVQDVTSQVIFENNLIQANKDKTILVQEVHHRVKNNLQLISSFINLEKKFHKDNPYRIINVTEDRIKSLALIHERIYNEYDMNYIRVSHFLEDFDNNLYMFSSKDIDFITDVDDDLTLTVDIITPLTLIINELTTNSFKYAFNEYLGRDKIIYKSIKLFEEDDQQFYEFKFSDSGVGLADDFDISKTRSLGWMIISSLVGQLDGEYELFNKDGLNFVMKFPCK